MRAREEELEKREAQRVVRDNHYTDTNTDHDPNTTLKTGG